MRTWPQEVEQNAPSSPISFSRTAKVAWSSIMNATRMRARRRAWGRWRIRLPHGGVGRIGRAWLLDDFSRLQEQRLCDGQPQRLGGPEVDNQFELRGLLHGQVARLGPFENLVHEDGGLSILVIQ